MLALTLATIALVQAPQAMKAWVDQDGDPSRPDSYVVSGFVELSPKAAWESAKARAQEAWQERLAALGQGYLDRHVPAWLPAQFGARPRSTRQAFATSMHSTWIWRQAL